MYTNKQTHTSPDQQKFNQDKNAGIKQRGGQSDKLGGKKSQIQRDRQSGSRDA